MTSLCRHSGILGKYRGSGDEEFYCRNHAGEPASLLHLAAITKSSEFSPLQQGYSEKLVRLISCKDVCPEKDIKCYIRGR